MAHFTCLAAARQYLLARAGWDVGRDGLSGAPSIRVVVGANQHATVDRALRFLGIGTASIREVPADEQGRMVVEALRDELGRADGPTIVCVQAGDINTGAFDDFHAAADASEAADAWLHVDGAIGLWAAASPSLRHLVAGFGRADSWATDAHKLLNVPFDSGIAFCAHPASHRAALSVRSAYLVHADDGARRDGLRPRALAPRARVPDLRDAPHARSRRNRGSRRPQLRPSARSPRASPSSPAARFLTTSCSTRC